MKKKITGIILGGVFIITSNAWAAFTPSSSKNDTINEPSINISSTPEKINLGEALKAKSLALSGKTKVSNLTPGSLISNGIYNQDTIQKVNSIIKEMNKATLKSYSKSLTANNEGLKLKGILEKAIEKRKAEQTPKETYYDVQMDNTKIRVHFDANGNPTYVENLNLSEDDTNRTKQWSELKERVQYQLLNQIDPEKYPIYDYSFDKETGVLTVYKNNQEIGAADYLVQFDPDNYVLKFYIDGKEVYQIQVDSAGASMIGDKSYGRYEDENGNTIGYLDKETHKFYTVEQFIKMGEDYQTANIKYVYDNIDGSLVKVYPDGVCEEPDYIAKFEEDNIVFYVDGKAVVEKLISGINEVTECGVTFLEIRDENGGIMGYVEKGTDIFIGLGAHGNWVAANSKYRLENGVLNKYNAKGEFLGSEDYTVNFDSDGYNLCFKVNGRTVYEIPVSGTGASSIGDKTYDKYKDGYGDVIGYLDGETGKFYTVEQFKKMQSDYDYSQSHASYGDTTYHGKDIRVYFDVNGNPTYVENADGTLTWDKYDSSAQKVILNGIDPEKYPIYEYIYNFSTGELEEYKNYQENGTIKYLVTVESDRIHFYNEGGDELNSYWFYTQGAKIGSTNYTKLIDARGEVIGYTDAGGNFITASHFDEMYNKATPQTYSLTNEGLMAYNSLGESLGTPAYTFKIEGEKLNFYVDEKLVISESITTSGVNIGGTQYYKLRDADRNACGYTNASKTTFYSVEQFEQMRADSSSNAA